MMTEVVVGSGPCAWAAVMGIIARGGTPVVVDFGQFPKIDPPKILGSSALAIKGSQDRARVFGYPRSLVSSEDAGHLPISSARGGLSRVWGSGILARGIDEFPELSEVFHEISGAFDSLFELIPSTASKDQLSLRFPAPAEHRVAPQSARFSKMVAQLQDEDPKTLVGYPRLAMRTEGGACLRCGSCLVGCPEGLFFSSEVHLSQLELSGLCRLVTGPVLKLEIEDSGVNVVLPSQRIKADRVYLAAGPIGTPSLLQRSGMAPTHIRVLDSAVFYSALINLNQSLGDEAEFTAAQASILATKPGPSDFQVSVYESNPDHGERIRAMLPLLRHVLKVPRIAINRVNPIIGFLDSAVSGHLDLRFQGERTWVRRVANPSTRPAANEVLKRVASRTKTQRMFAVPRLILIPKPGSGYHSGAAMPMGGEYVDLSSGLRFDSRIKLVDATVLPRVPAGSHTFTAMANAFRVGRAN
jgi:hypothetical protein